MCATLDDRIKWHGAELRNVLADVTRSIDANPRGRQTDPPRYVRFLWSSLRGERVAPNDHVNGGPNHAIRQIHDFYGWKAKDAAARRGVCAGALYRSAGYMSIDHTVRDGSKGRNRTVHIEHSIPVAVLVKAIRHHLASFATPSDLHYFLVCHSICAALSYQEELTLRGRVANSRSQAFDGNGNLCGDYPFMRYQPLVDQRIGFRLFNVVSGQEIQLDQFKFSDHVSTLEKASRQIAQSDNCRNMIYSLEMFEL